MPRLRLTVLILAAALVPPTGPLLAAAPQPRAELDTISNLARSGAPELALRMMDRDQPAFADSPQAWRAWERERIYIYQSSKQWRAITQRLQRLPAGIDGAFRAWAREAQARAWLEEGQGAKARNLLREILWEGPSVPDAETRSRARQLVIRSYLTSHDSADAQAAIQRYRQDYPKAAGDWRLMQARLYLGEGHPADALELLKQMKAEQGHPLILLTQLRAEALAPGAVLQKAVSLGSDKDRATDERRAAWAVAAEAAQALGNRDARIAALQKGLALPVPASRDSTLHIDPDMLWTTYLDLGEEEGNALRLVVGDDTAWFAAAEKKYANDPVRARALYAVVAFNAFDAGHRDLAQWRFARSLEDGPGGSAILAALYLHSSRFSDIDSIPAPVRYMLADYALSEPDIPLASKLMAGLDQAPPETDPAAWQLQRARVLILGGRVDAGIDALRKLLADTGKLDIDHVLQVVFDLQTVGRHKAALEFFHALLKRPLDAEHHREMLYWMADSYKALGDHVEAAQLYLLSAIQPGPFTMDPWAQTARYHAAEELAAAGLVDDARHLYQALLNATQDPGRQAVLRRAIQQLLLVAPEAGKATPVSGN